MPVSVSESIERCYRESLHVRRVHLYKIAHIAVHCSVHWCSRHTHSESDQQCDLILQASNAEGFFWWLACMLKPCGVGKKDSLCLYCVFHTNLFAFISSTQCCPLPAQGISVEFLCRPTSAGFDLDVCSARHDRQALHPLSDPLCRLWLTAGFCHCDGTLYPPERGRGWFNVCLVHLLQRIRADSKSDNEHRTVTKICIIAVHFSPWSTW